MGYISTLTFANMVYALRKELNPGKIAEVPRQLSPIFELAELAPGDLTRAGELKWSGFRTRRGASQRSARIISSHGMPGISETAGYRPLLRQNC